MVWRAVIGILALRFAGDGLGENLSSESLSYLSNRAVGFIYLGLAVYPVVFLLRRAEPRTAWVRGACTIMMTVVAVVFLGWGEAPDGPHAVIPALVLIDFLFVGRSQFRARWWEPPTWIAFLLVYLVYHRANDLGLYEGILGEDNIGTAVPVMPIGCIVINYILFGLIKARQAISSAIRSPRQTDPTVRVPGNHSPV